MKKIFKNLLFKKSEIFVSKITRIFLRNFFFFASKMCKIRYSFRIFRFFKIQFWGIWHNQTGNNPQTEADYRRYLPS